VPAAVDISSENPLAHTLPQQASKRQRKGEPSPSQNVEAPRQQQQQQQSEQPPVIFLGDLYAIGMLELRVGFTPGHLGYSHHPWFVKKRLRMSACLNAHRRLRARWRKERKQQQQQQQQQQ